MTLNDKMIHFASEKGCHDRLSYFAWMWIAIVGYSTFWGFGLTIALTDLNLLRLDKLMTVTIGLFAFVISVQLSQFYSQMQLVMAEKFSQVAPMLKNFSFFMFLTLALETGLIPLTSTNMTPADLKVGTDGWDSILELQCIADLAVSTVIISMAYVMYNVDSLAELCIKNIEEEKQASKSNSCNSINTMLTKENQEKYNQMS